MNGEYPRSTLSIAGRPVYATLMHFPLACFLGALLTDIAYARTAEMMWADFSAWLIFAGLVIGLPAALIGLVDLLISRGLRAVGAAWIHFLGDVIALVVAFFDMLVHNRDAWTSVVPTGLTLSAVVVVVMIASRLLAWRGIYPRRVGAAG